MTVAPLSRTTVAVIFAFDEDFTGTEKTRSRTAAPVNVILRTPLTLIAIARACETRELNATATRSDEHLREPSAT